MNYSIWPIEGTRDHLPWPGRLRRGPGESEVETCEFGMGASAAPLGRRYDARRRRQRKRARANRIRNKPWRSFDASRCINSGAAVHDSEADGGRHG